MILIVMESRSECGLGTGSVPLVYSGAHRLTEGLPGLEGWQVGMNVWLVLDGATGEVCLTWDISTDMVACLRGGLQHNKMWLLHK